MFKTIKVFLFLSLMAGMFIWYMSFRRASLKPQENFLVPSPTPVVVSGTLNLAENETNLMDLATEVGNYRVAWEIVAPESTVRIGINEELEFGSQQLMDRLSCRVLTNAAFYDTANQPLGLLMDEAATLSAWRPNQLLHGLVGFDKTTKQIVINDDPGNYDFEWAVQAGPIFWQDGQPKSLNLLADQEARRVIAGVTDQGQLLLLTITADDSLYVGPKLADISSIIKSWQLKTNIVLVAGLNLDGGTASAFLSPTLKLRELKPIGSYICVE